MIKTRGSSASLISLCAGLNSTLPNESHLLVMSAPYRKLAAAACSSPSTSAMSSSCVSLLNRPLGVKLDCEFLALTSGKDADREWPELRLLRIEDATLPRALGKLERVLRGKLERFAPARLDRLLRGKLERFGSGIPERFAVATLGRADPETAEDDGFGMLDRRASAPLVRLPVIKVLVLRFP